MTERDPTTSSPQDPATTNAASPSSPGPSQDGAPKPATGTPAPLDNEIGFISGKKGSGKTTLARHLLTRARRTLVLDTLGTDYGGGAVVYRPADLRSYYERVRDHSDFCIIARPQGADMVDAFFGIVRRSRDVWAFVEECDRYCNASSIHDDLYWSINYGRQFGQSVVGCARRPAAVNRTWTANADWIVAHQCQEPRDLKYLAEFGFNPDELKTLPQFTWRHVGHSRLFR